jgi:hypothetical protein
MSTCRVDLEGNRVRRENLEHSKAELTRGARIDQSVRFDEKVPISSK